MKVAIAAKAIEPIICGGAEKTTKRVFDGLKSSDIDVRLFTKYKKPEIRPELGPEVDDTWSRKTANEILQWNPDIVYVSRYWGETLPLYIDNIPIFAMHHSTEIEKYPLDELFKSDLIKLTRKVITKENVINIVPSISSERYFETLSNRKLRIFSVPLGADKIFSLSKDVHEVSRSKHNQFLYLGRIAPKKGLLLLIEALAEFKKPYKLLIAGEYSKLYQTYYEEVKHLALQKGVPLTFLGYVTEKEKASLITTSSLAIQPSLWGESFGITCLEALECGCPLVCSDLFLETGVVNSQIASIFVRGSKNGLINSIEEILELTEKDITKFNMAKEWAAKFTWKRHTNELIRLFQSCVNL